MRRRPRARLSVSVRDEQEMGEVAELPRAPPEQPEGEQRVGQDAARRGIGREQRQPARRRAKCDLGRTGVSRSARQAREGQRQQVLHPSHAAFRSPLFQSNRRRDADLVDVDQPLEPLPSVAGKMVARNNSSHSGLSA